MCLAIFFILKQFFSKSDILMSYASYDIKSHIMSNDGIYLSSVQPKLGTNGSDFAWTGKINFELAQRKFIFCTGIENLTFKMFWFIDNSLIKSKHNLVYFNMERCELWFHSQFMFNIQNLRQQKIIILKKHHFRYNIWYFFQHLVRTSGTMIFLCKLTAHYL